MRRGECQKCPSQCVASILGRLFCQSLSFDSAYGSVVLVAVEVVTFVHPADLHCRTESEHRFLLQPRLFSGALFVLLFAVESSTLR